MHAVVVGTGASVGRPAAAVGPGGIGVVVDAGTHWLDDPDGIDVDESAAASMLEAHGVGAIAQVRAGPGGLPVQGGAGGDDGVQVDVVDVDVVGAEVGVLAEGQGEL